MAKSQINENQLQDEKYLDVIGKPEKFENYP